MSSEAEPDTSIAAIGARIRDVRIARGLTQGALARAVGVSPSRWNNYEQGNRLLPPDLLAKLWQVTGATSDYILFERMEGLPADLYKRLILQQIDTEKTA